MKKDIKQLQNQIQKQPNITNYFDAGEKDPSKPVGQMMGYPEIQPNQASNLMAVEKKVPERMMLSHAQQ